MKSKKQLIDEYIAKEYPFIITPYQDEDDTGYCGYLIDIPAVIAYEDTIEDTLALLADARKEWICYAVENNIDIPEPTSLRKTEEFSGRITLRIPKTLHRTLTNKAGEESISLNSYIVSKIESGLAKDETSKIYKEIKKLNEKLEKRVSYTEQLSESVVVDASSLLAFSSIPKYIDFPAVRYNALEWRTN